MSSAIEDTVKALVDFESELDRAKAELSDASRKATKDAADWADSARSAALSQAQAMASQRVEKAKADAQAEAETIRKKGETDLRSFESSIAKKKSKAAELVASMLLGEKK